MAYTGSDILTDVCVCVLSFIIDLKVALPTLGQMYSPMCVCVLSLIVDLKVAWPTLGWVRYTHRCVCVCVELDH